MIELVVEGLPAPKGSKRHVGNGRMIESSVRLPAWKAALDAAVDAWLLEHPGHEPLDGPLRFDAVYYMPRPQRPKFDAAPAVPPDGSKLQRAIEDQLQPRLFTDDGRIVEWSGRKVWGPPVGCKIRISKATVAV